MESKPKWLDHMRHVLRLKHMSIRTETAYVQWAKRFILFHHKHHPADMGALRTSTTNILLKIKVESPTSQPIFEISARQAPVWPLRHRVVCDKKGVRACGLPAASSVGLPLARRGHTLARRTPGCAAWGDAQGHSVLTFTPLS